eukprot:scaffold2740_cov418-Prasinococcus_capsulatus_cf.AAC.16
MGKGKIAAQCSHATLGIYKKLARYENLLSVRPCGWVAARPVTPGAKESVFRLLQTWESTGQAKVVVKVECEEDMIELQEKAKEAGLPCHVVIDAGRTQIAPNRYARDAAASGRAYRHLACVAWLLRPLAGDCSRTVLAVLGPTDLLDSVTGHLKLL